MQRLRRVGFERGNDLRMWNDNQAMQPMWPIKNLLNFIKKSNLNGAFPLTLSRSLTE